MGQHREYYQVKQGENAFLWKNVLTLSTRALPVSLRLCVVSSLIAFILTILCLPYSHL